jgi:N-acetylglucosaminyl-diphospho-decaprenol L-rhamnosyltransferase
VRIGLATIAYGRRAHLERQAAMVANLPGLARYVVVTMDDGTAPTGAERLSLLAPDGDRLRLAAARNAAMVHLEDCDLVVLLDVDCLPDPGLLAAYRSAAAQLQLQRSLLMGPVGWLDQPVPATGLDAELVARARQSVKRSFPEHGLAAERRPELFWSLSCALSPAAHRRVGGFDETFAGWGAEDTDYGRRALERGLELWKVGGAWAYHQPHPPARSRPGQIAALAQNAVHFHARWGDWPMPDVLTELAERGQIVWKAEGTTLQITRPGLDPDQRGDPQLSGRPVSRR